LAYLKLKSEGLHTSLPMPIAIKEHSLTEVLH